MCKFRRGAWRSGESLTRTTICSTATMSARLSRRSTSGALRMTPGCAGSLTELNLEFHGRHELVEEGEPQTVCVLPWLPLDEPLTFGAIRVDHWSAVRENVEEPARTTA